MSAWRRIIGLSLLAFAAAQGGCTLLDAERHAAAVPARVLGRTDSLAIITPGSGDTLQTLAATYLGDARRWWWIADSNDLHRDAVLDPQRALSVPLHAGELADIDASGHQLVPILAYHRFDNSGDRLAIDADTFEQHLRYLLEHDYRVVPLRDVERWLADDRPLPRRAVVLTIDDGFRSVYDIAYPLLLQYNMPATVFVYTDFVSAGGLSWAQLREMQASGLVSVQSHSKTHMDLTLAVNDPLADIDAETGGVRRALRRRLGGDAGDHYAYPYGATNPAVLENVARNGYSLGLTVRRGGNAFYRNRLLLRRSMVFSDQGAQGFVDALQTWEPLPG